MELRELEEKYGSFYVPAFTVKVGGKDLVRELFLTVTSVEVELQQSAASHFTFTVANAFDWEDRDFVANRNEARVDLLQQFAFGSDVEISFGYGEPSKLKKLMRGIITELGTSFSSGATPELTISGYDNLYPLTSGKNTRHWEDKRDSEVVADLVRETGLSTNIQQTDPPKARIDQSQESDMSFLSDKLAKRNRATFYARGDSFYFGPRNNDKQPALTIGWGKGLLTFSPQANLAGQVESVEVYGHNLARGETIVGKARRGDERARDRNRRSGAEAIASAVNTRPAMRVRAFVRTQAEADARARSILEERAQEFLKGEGESIGLPEIVPDIKIGLEGLGKTFSKSYYVTSAKHKVDGSGYKTGFSIQENTL